MGVWRVTGGAGTRKKQHRGRRLGDSYGSGKEEELTVGEWLKRPGKHRETDFAKATESNAPELTSGRHSICTQSPHTRA